MTTNDRNSNESTAPSEVESNGSKAKSRSGGPRTPTGKRRSSRNAITTEVYVRDRILATESAAEYEAFRRGIFEERNPQTPSEFDNAEHEVDARWRRKRLSRIETAQLLIAAVKASNAHWEQWREAWGWSRSEESGGGMLRNSSNPYLAQRTLEYARMLRARIEKFGLCDGLAQKLLWELYGWDLSSKCASNKPGDDVQKMKNELLTTLDEEIKILERCKSSEKLSLDAKGLAGTLMPWNCSGVIDSIDRHERHLSREIHQHQEYWRKRREEREQSQTFRLKLD